MSTNYRPKRAIQPQDYQLGIAWEGSQVDLAWKVAPWSRQSY